MPQLMALPNLTRQVWILAAGRLMLQVGTGFILFIAPIFFVEDVGLSATLVGIGLGSASVSGMLGRFWGGNWTDQPSWGRRNTLLLAAGISAIADIPLALTNGFPLLVIGQLLAGLGMGLYWPPAEAAIADLVQGPSLNEAFAINRLADSLGLSIGVASGGTLISLGLNHRWLFVLDGISFAVFFAIIWLFVPETANFQNYSPQLAKTPPLSLLGDRQLLLFIAANVVFTMFISQTQSILPLFWRKYVPSGASLSESALSWLFTWQIILSVVIQIPVVRLLQRFTHTRSLLLSLGFWVVGFLSVWSTGFTDNLLAGSILSVSIFAIANVSYTPSASALIAKLAPLELRGIYFAWYSQCWAAGYLLGPVLGGWALDQGSGSIYWLILSTASLVPLLTLRTLAELNCDTPHI
ncbi:MAG: MFS transporter [Cyanobacteria bacterium P01_H01_bin.15]